MIAEQLNNYLHLRSMKDYFYSTHLISMKIPSNKFQCSARYFYIIMVHNRNEHE